MHSTGVCAKADELRSCRAAFIELVGRGKTGLGLEEDVERLVAFGGAAELAGGGPVSPSPCGVPRCAPDPL